MQSWGHIPSCPPVCIQHPTTWPPTNISYQPCSKSSQQGGHTWEGHMWAAKCLLPSDHAPASGHNKEHQVTLVFVLGVTLYSDVARYSCLLRVSGSTWDVVMTSEWERCKLWSATVAIKVYLPHHKSFQPSISWLTQSKKKKQPHELCFSYHQELRALRYAIWHHSTAALQCLCHYALQPHT